MANLVWTIGGVRVTRIAESVTELVPSDLIPDATPEALSAHQHWLRPAFLTESGKFTLSIHGLVVESQGRRILVDTCVGERAIPGYEQLGGPSAFLRDLEASGFPRESIDTVLCTHLHFDHIGWNTMQVDGKWVPTFPRARYLFARTEWEHWSRASDKSYAFTLDESVRPVLEAGLAELVEAPHRLTDEVWLDPTPGHTPGHVAVRIASRGAQALITGDLTHHPVQWAEPDWGMGADTDSKQAARTRRRLLDEHGDAGTLVIGTHYAPPCAGELRSVGSGWIFQIRR
jgi:glyoxylase-like metal-dependent hydrolase (beta-lactamase superfamily II)